MGISSFETLNDSKLYAEEKEIIGKLKKNIFNIAGCGVQKYAPNIDGHQDLLVALANIFRIRNKISIHFFNLPKVSF